MFSLRSSSYDPGYAPASSYDPRGNYIFSLNKPKKLPMVLTHFLSFQLSSGIHYRTFFVLLFLQTLRPKYRILLSRRFFLLEHTCT